MIKYGIRALMLLVAVALVAAIYMASTKQQITNPFAGRRGGGARVATDVPTPVAGTEVLRTDVPLYLDGVGTARALNNVTVRPQADGKIVKIHFREGQTIEKGALLAEIDPTPYKAALDQVEARRAVTQTQLTNAKRDAERYARIPGVVAQKTVDNQTAQVAQFEAQLRADDAAVASARASLDYTRVTAPITGRTGLRLIDEGNTVRAGADTGIVTITQVQPISVLFNLPQQQLQRVNRAQARGAVAVEALDADGKTALDKGTLQVVDNQVDQTTGTIRMKADFPNADLQLWPGQFVNVRLLVETLTQVTVVPTQAIQRGPTGVFVYVVDADDRAKVRPVELTLQLETQSIVKSGVEAGERIITSGFARMQDNARVTFTRAGDPPPPAKGVGGATASTARVEDPRARFARIREACASDLQTHCPNLQRGEMRACMETNKPKFAASCQAAFDAPPASLQPVATGNGGGDGSGKGLGKGEGRRKRNDSANGNGDSGATAAVPATERKGATP